MQFVCFQRDVSWHVKTADVACVPIPANAWTDTTGDFARILNAPRHARTAVVVLLWTNVFVRLDGTAPDVSIVSKTVYF